MPSNRQVERLPWKKHTLGANAGEAVRPLMDVIEPTRVRFDKAT